MDFEFTDEHVEFRHEIREWMSEALPDAWLADDWIVPDDPEKKEAAAREWQRRLYDDGWACMQWPEEYGGRGIDPWQQSIWDEEVAKAGLKELDMAYGSGPGMIGLGIIEEGTEAQKERFLPPILKGDAVWVLGFSEPNAGSDVASLTTSAERSGDEFLINGQKIWTTHAHFADHCILVARTDASGNKHEGITVFLLDMDQEGVSVDPIREVTDEKRFNQVYFDDAVVEAKNVLGEVDNGWGVASRVLALEHSFSEVFEMERRFDEILEYCRRETRDGRPLVEDPIVRQKLADFEARIHACKMARYRNISYRIDDDAPEPVGTLDMLASEGLRVHLEKFATDLQGPEAVLWGDSPNAGTWFRDYLWAMGFWIAGGTNDVLRNIIGEHTLGLPQDPKSSTSHRTDEQETSSTD